MKLKTRINWDKFAKCFGLVLILLIIFTNNPVHSEWVLQDHALYTGYTSETVTMYWDACPDALSYEVRVKSFERDEYVITGSTGNTSITFSLPRTGHYIPEIRAVYGVDDYSDWAVTTNPTYATVGGQAKGWWIYGSVEPIDSGGIVIN